VTAGAFLGAALWKAGPQYNFWGAAAAGAIGTVVYTLHTRRRQNGSSNGPAAAAKV